MALDERLFRIVRQPEATDTVWFVFSARSVPPGKFSMSGVMRDLPGDKVFFNCLDNSWFLDVEEDINARIAEVLAERAYARRLFIGTSMGGAGALMFARQHDATRVLAFSLNTLIGERFTHSALYIKDQQRDLLAGMTPAFAARCTAVLGMLDPADTETARRLMKARVDTRIVRSNHDTAGMLARKDAILPVLQAFGAGEPVVIPEELQATREEMRLSHNSSQLLQRIDAAGVLDRDTLRGLVRMDRRYAKEIVRKLTAQASSDHDYATSFDYAIAALEAGLAFDFIVPQLLNAAFRLRDERAARAAFYVPAYLQDHDTDRARLLGRKVAELAADADLLALLDSPGSIDRLSNMASRAARAGAFWAARDLVGRIPRLSRSGRDHFVAAQSAQKLGEVVEALRHAKAAAKAAPREERYGQLVERLTAMQAAAAPSPARVDAPDEPTEDDLVVEDVFETASGDGEPA